MNEYPYWWDTLPAAPVVAREHSDTRAQAAGSLPGRADAVIVGAGYTGLAAARQLACAGASVLVCDSEQIGWGASSRNGGQVLTGLKLDPATLVQRFGEGRARELFEVANESVARLEALIAQESIDCDYVRAGHIQAASKPAHFDAFRDEQALLARVFGHRVHLLPRAEQRAEVGSDTYHGLLVDEASGALNPARYVHGLAAAAIRAGATISVDARVVSIERLAAGWTVKTTAGDVETRDVLLATNGYTDGAAPALQRRLIPIGSYVIGTEPLDASLAGALLPRRRVAFDSKHFLHYFRVTADGRLLFGGRAEFAAPNPAVVRRAASILREGMIAVFPELASARIDYAWGGNVAFTRDQMPRAGMLDGMYYSGGYCGHGIAMATLLGEQIARRMAGEPIAHPLFDDEFPAIPLYSGRPWFLPVVGAYYQVKDWLQ